MSSDSDRIGRAGDDVMGRMGPAERERAEMDLERDPMFREAVLRLSERLRRANGLAEDDLWRSVESDLARLPQMRAMPERSKAAHRPEKKRSRDVRSPSASAGGWKAALLVAGVAAACGAGYLAGNRLARPPEPVAVVALGNEAGKTAGILEIGPDGGLRFVPVADTAPDDDRVLRLWTLYDEKVGFVPLGTLATAAASRWQGPELPATRPGQIFRVTAEVGAGDRPSGPTRFEGRARTIGQ